MTGRYLEDFAIGQTFGSGTRLNQNGEAVQVAIGYLLVQRRPDGNPLE